MTDKFKKGDKVVWNSAGHHIEGTVVEKITSQAKASKFNVKASESEPKYKVKSDKTGKKALHKADALNKV